MTQDKAGNNNELSITVSAISTGTHDSKWFAFRLKKTQRQPVYLRLRATVAIPNTADVYFDDIALAEGVELYPGGPFLAAFAGRQLASLSDVWTVSPTNDRTGTVQEWMNRTCDMADAGLLLPISLLAMQVLSRMRTSFNVELSPRLLVTQQFTVAVLSKAILMEQIRQSDTAEIDVILDKLDALTLDKLKNLTAIGGKK